MFAARARRYCRGDEVSHGVAQALYGGVGGTQRVSPRCLYRLSVIPRACSHAAPASWPITNTSCAPLCKYIAFAVLLDAGGAFAFSPDITFQLAMSFFCIRAVWRSLHLFGRMDVAAWRCRAHHRALCLFGQSAVRACLLW